MVYTKAEREGWRPKDKAMEDLIIPEIVDDPVENIKKLKPIEGLEFDKFSSELASNMQNPQKYGGIISGFIGRLKLNRQTKAVQLFEEYLLKLRTASDSAAQLQETLLKNKIIFYFQSQIAAQRVKEEWAVEQKGREYQHASIDADIAHKKFMTRFYETADPNQLSETALMLLNLMSPISVSTSSTSVTPFDAKAESKAVQYGSMEGLLKLKQQDKLMEILMQEYIADIGIKKATIRKTSAEAKKTEVQADLEEWDVKEQMKK